MTTVIGIAAVWTVPKGAWKRTYASASVALAGLAFLTISINWLTLLTLGEKVELVCVIAGVALLIVSYIARFRETAESKNELAGSEGSDTSSSDSRTSFARFLIGQATSLRSGAASINETSARSPC